MPADSDTSNAPASESPNRRPHKLNWLGRAVQWGGWMRTQAREAADVVQTRTQAVAERSKKAFYEGLDPNMEDARILDEEDEGTRK